MRFRTKTVAKSHQDSTNDLGSASVPHAMVSNSDDEESEEPGRRRYCTLSIKTLERLQRLKVRSTHGRSVPAIMTGMIEAGIRAAHKDGYLTDEDMS